LRCLLHLVLGDLQSPYRPPSTTTILPINTIYRMSPLPVDNFGYSMNEARLVIELMTGISDTMERIGEMRARCRGVDYDRVKEIDADPERAQDAIRRWSTNIISSHLKDQVEQMAAFCKENKIDMYKPEYKKTDSFMNMMMFTKKPPLFQSESVPCAIASFKSEYHRSLVGFS
ncbi:hypothetical protein PENTCL1PPCAC_18567, partial [Pristionchus entomophagus]